ncbi:MAG: 3-phosphoshikimate 1-carboxyvinyltransferase, partial [Desulforhopalus sp.]|nr:3-phosphoshikimate 1-carboxyvinyltransferase [Desulforhopalus sp.]
MIEIQPVQHIDAAIEVPGSKSLTQRALIAASLAKGTSTLSGPLESDDTRYSSEALMQMGIAMDKGKKWVIHGKAGLIKSSREPIFLGNNGTATRFLTSVAALGNGNFLIDGDARMHQRPIGPLMAPLRGWGVDI